MSKNNKAADLLKVLGQRTPTANAIPAKTPAASVAHPSAPRRKLKPRSVPRDEARPKGRGKAIQFYLHDADEKLIREFSVWLSPHRKRVNYSLVIKAVLRAAKTGSALLAGYDEGLAVSEAHRATNRRSDNV